MSSELKTDLTDFERDRIEAILRSAALKNWDQFKALTDRPFINPNTMREQFFDSCEKIDLSAFSIAGSFKVAVTPDGARGITTYIPNKFEGGGTIRLVLMSLVQRMIPIAAIMGFYEMPPELGG